MTDKNPSEEAVALALEIAESRNYPGFPKRAAFRIDAFAARIRQQAIANIAPAWESRETAWRMIEDAVRVLGPAGALNEGDSQGEPPDPLRDAERLIIGIQKIAAQTTERERITLREWEGERGQNVRSTTSDLAAAMRLVNNYLVNVGVGGDETTHHEVDLVNSIAVSLVAARRAGAREMRERGAAVADGEFERWNDKRRNSAKPLEIKAHYMLQEDTADRIRIAIRAIPDAPETKQKS